MGRATSSDRLYLNICIFISIHTLRGEGDKSNTIEIQRIDISIHTLRGEGDEVEAYTQRNIDYISIHTLRGEGDRCADEAIVNSHHDFNPHPPWGGRLKIGKK